MRDMCVWSSPVRCEHASNEVHRERETSSSQFQARLTGTNHQFSSWGTTEIQEDCCQWEGVHCLNKTGNVIELVLDGEPNGHLMFPSQLLSGVISPSLLQLKNLEHLEFYYFNFRGPIPMFFGSFTRLKYLRLSDVGFEGRIPHELGNLSSLHTLDLRLNRGSFANDLEWLSPLQSLTRLYLDHVDLHNATDWLKTISKLPLLRELKLFNCQLPRVTPFSMDFTNFSTSLTVLDLSFNNLDSSIYSWLFNYSGSLRNITLGGNNLLGQIPNDFEKMVSLVHLDISDNKLEGGIPSFFSNYSNLKTLTLSANNLLGNMPDLSNNLTGRVSSTLEFLHLDRNRFSGRLPDIVAKFFPSLRELDLGNNQLTGVLTESIGSLSNLETLVLGSNHFEGVISESHMSKLTRLTVLDFSFNSRLEFQFQSNWIPPFQLNTLNLGNCNIGPHFPKWLQTQKEIYEIDISAAGFSGEIPNWFHNQMSQLIVLNLSHNQMNGTLPKLDKFDFADLSSNDFEGHVPRFSESASFVKLSKNRFYGKITFLCDSSYKSLWYLDLSNNHLSGQLSDCWSHLGELAYLNLANNNLSGSIPSSMGSLSKIEVLQLRNNSFTAKLPQSWKDSAQLNFIDFGQNKLSGTIPLWIWSNLSNLVVLSLGSNNFRGNIPQNICNLSKIQILDLSKNNISGTIPRCIRNFSAMAREGSSTISMENSISYSPYVIANISYIEEATLIWKGTESIYKSNIKIVKIIDFSSNSLTGVIPLEITSLVGLGALNLSRNRLTGILKPEIGELKLLDFLDLSGNRLSGEIPSSLSQLSFLGMLNLSFNNFVGRVPWTNHLQTFDASSFEGNPGLCGRPLTQGCPGDELPQNPNFNEGTSLLGEEEHEEKLITMGFYISVVLGFILGFCGVCGPLFFNKFCRHFFSKFLNKMEDWVYTVIAPNLAKLQ